MNLINEEEQKPKEDSSKKLQKIVITFIIISIIAIVGIFMAIVYIQNSTLKFYINGVLNENAKQLIVVEEDGTIYFPIKEIATYLGYESYNGEYTDKSEDASKCYVQGEEEITNFALNSNKIYKLLISDKTANYEYFYISKPVKAINGKLYATTDAIEQAFNAVFINDTDSNTIGIYTMPHLIQAYSTKVLDYGYETIAEGYTNQKSVLEDMLIVTKNSGKTYAVIDVSGKTIIEAKYDNIEYLPNSGDFLVESNGRVGIISAKKQTKVQIIYESLELIDKDSGLYVAKRNNKYGVIDSNGKIKVYIEYDQIGIDNTKFSENDIKNKYLLDNGMIPAKKDEVWGAFDKNGNKVLEFQYESFGYIAQSNKDTENLLMIPEYNVMIAKRESKYTLISPVGTELCLPVLDDVYMTISAGKKYYYTNYEENIGIDVLQLLDALGAKQESDYEEREDDDNKEIEKDTQNQAQEDERMEFIEVETE